MRGIIVALLLLLAPAAMAQSVLGPYAPTGRRITSGSSDTATAADFQNSIFWKSASGANKTETLPACTAGLNGRWLYVSDAQGDASAHPINVIAASGTLGGTTAGVYITSNRGSLRLSCDGATTNWVVSGQFAPGNNVRAVTSGPDTIATTDNGSLVAYNSSSAVAVTLQAGTSTTGFSPNSFAFEVVNYGTGLVTFTASGGTINSGSTTGASTVALAQGQLAVFFLDASGNYNVMGPTGFAIGATGTIYYALNGIVTGLVPPSSAGTYELQIQGGSGNSPQWVLIAGGSSCGALQADHSVACNAVLYGMMHL